MEDIKTKPRSAVEPASTGYTAIYAEVRRGDTRRLNWRAMNYYVRRGDYAAAAECRGRVKSWNATGPV